MKEIIQDLNEEDKKLLMYRIEQCNSINNNCDFLLEHSDCDMLTEIFDDYRQIDNIKEDYYKESDFNLILISRLDKAIEYIEDRMIVEQAFTLDKEQCKELLRILKGKQLKPLYKLPENKNIKLYIEDKVIIFGHLDGLYSYCWLEEDKSKVVHIKCTTMFEEYKDGYRLVDEERAL